MNAEAQPGPSSLPREGDVIADKYRIDGLIAQGGMGAVFKATHTVSGKPVALKWILPERSGSQAELRMVREAQATARIDHPNVVDVYDVGRDRGSVYLVMELLRGETLADRLERGRLEPEEAIELVMPAMRGVAAAHAEGVIHRDLKPENILLCCSPDGTPREPKVLDFGISKFADNDAPGRQNLTQSRAVLGTPYYMSPEQARGAATLDHRADIYAFGVILYELLSDSLPFDGDTYNALIIRIATTAAQELGAVRADLPPQLVAIIMRAIHKDPDARFQTVAEFARALESFSPRARFAPTHTSGLYAPVGSPAADEQQALAAGANSTRMGRTEHSLSPTLDDESDTFDTLARQSSPQSASSASSGRGGGMGEMDIRTGATVDRGSGHAGPVGGGTLIGSPMAAEATAKADPGAHTSTTGSRGPSRAARLTVGALVVAGIALALGWGLLRGRDAMPGTVPAAATADEPFAMPEPEQPDTARPTALVETGAASVAPAAGRAMPVPAAAVPNEATTADPDPPATALEVPAQDTEAEVADAPSSARDGRVQTVKRKQRRTAAARRKATATAPAEDGSPKLAKDWDDQLGTAPKPKARPASAAGHISLDDL